MIGLGTLVNSGSILIGAAAGLLLRRGLPEMAGKHHAGCGIVHHCYWRADGF